MRDWEKEERRLAERQVSREEIEATARSLRAWDPRVEAVWLFGSYARGENRPTSDVDFAVMTRREESRDMGHREDLRAFLEDALGVPVDVVLLHVDLAPGLLWEALCHPVLLSAADPEDAGAFASGLRGLVREEWPRLERSWQRTLEWAGSSVPRASNEALGRRLREVLAQLEVAVQVGEADLTNTQIAALERLLQLAIQITIDLGDRVVAQRGAEEPPRQRDIFSALQRLGTIEAAQAREMERLVGVRNTLVHDYMEYSRADLLREARGGLPVLRLVGSSLLKDLATGDASRNPQ